MSFEAVSKFEKKVAEFYGAPYAVAVDCCTHALELCLRYEKVEHFTVPKRTYISIPFLAKKLNITFDWRDEAWQDFYYLGDTNIIDAAVLWKKDSYVQGTHMCVSFQYRKHLNLGRGGMILTDNEKSVDLLKKMSYDGRIPNVPWREQNIDAMGYHYYMTPETAERGLKKLPEAISTIPKKWAVSDWPDLTQMEVFK
ncbi:MAG TPA: hypothetical protein EYN67_09350 [Flavobacteriales bacterium]|nr:hypothetical protein [Flavobacteriales bacterium]